MKTVRILSATVLGALFGSLANAQLLRDDFDTNTSTNYTIVSTGDAVATFAFDYSALGIPPAPDTTGGTTLGLKLEANVTSGAVHGITLHTNQTFTGDRVIKFDAWVNANGPFPGGGTGSTEFITCGVGGDGVSANVSGSGSGAWFAASGEGGSSRDYRAYKNAGEQFAESGQWAAGTSSAGGGAHNASDPYYAQFGSIDVGALPQSALFPQQTGITGPGSFGFAWHEVVIEIDADGGTGGATSVSWSIDGLPIATLDAGIGSAFSSDGAVTLGYMDIFSSISDNAALSFGLIDNLRIGDLAETTVYGSNPAHPAFGTANLVAVADPVIGTTGAFDLAYASSGAEIGVIVGGFAQASAPFLDGTVLVQQPFALSSLFITTPPATSFSFPLPNVGAFVGARLYFQAGVLDTVNPQTPFGVVFSDGLSWRLGL